MCLRSLRSPARARVRSAILGAAILALTSILHPDGAKAQSRTMVLGEHATLAGSAVVNFQELARKQALDLAPKPAVRPLLNDVLEETEGEPGAEGTAPAPIESSGLPFMPFAASPSASASFMGLDDIPMVDSSYIVIPPDVDGAVGPSKILQGLNNNYRILDKSTGAVLSTVGTATFWAPTGETALNGLTDPRTLYDPINNRWIVEMQTVTTGAGDILVGVSQTSDPSGNWFLYRFATAATIDFPIVGFNKNWLVIAINRYSAGGSFQRGISLVVNYPLARAGTGSATTFTQAAGTHFCTSPCATYSATSDTLYLVTHLSSASATYALDMITGTSAAPVYSSGGSLTRAGGGWVQPSGNLLPQSAPNSGTSACGATPCPIEVQDAQVRTAPVYRGGFIYYAQTVGLPSTGLTHTGLQWTKLNTPSGTVADGGRLEDPTATATNGGKWYSHPHIAVASNGDFMVGFGQFASNQHPGAGYAMHLAADAAGTIRDASIYHAGEDYYHKTFSTATGRNRWGDYSKVQVDPNDDRTLWTLNEYGKTRTGTDDGNGGANSSRWSTWWAAVAGPPPTVTLDAGPSQNEGNAGLSAFTFTARLSTAYSLPVTVTYQTADGSATAGSDYQSASGSITIPAGASTGTIPVNVIGDTACEPNETFTLTLTGATNATLGSPVVSTGGILNDDAVTITASAGPNGSISPGGAVVVACGANPTFSITPNAGYHVADVQVDGSSVGPVASYAFTNVQANHTIAASFAIDSFTITASAGANGSISPTGAVTVNSGGNQGFTITPNSGYSISDVLVDGSSVGALASYTFTNVQANHTITASFADAGLPVVQVLAPNGGETFAAGGSTSITWSASDNVGVTSVDVDYSLDQGGSWTSVAAGVANTGSVAWSIPNAPTVQGLVRVTAHDGAGNTGFDTSDSNFTIADQTGPVVTVLSPNGGESFAPGSLQSVTWTASDNVGIDSVNVDYSLNGTPGPWVPIQHGLANSGTVSWSVPGTASDSALVQVTAFDHALNQTSDLSDSLFQIQNAATAVESGSEFRFALHPAVPSPTRGAVQLRFSLAVPGTARFDIFDLGGRRIWHSDATSLGVGEHALMWPGLDERGTPATPGIYFVRLTQVARSQTIKLVILR